MVSKFAQSSIALFLAKSAFASDSAAPVPEAPKPQPAKPAEPDQKEDEEHHFVPTYEILGQPKSFEGGSPSLYESKDITTGMIRAYIKDVITNAGHSFTESEILVIGWGGMCWPVDGRFKTKINSILTPRGSQPEALTYVAASAITGTKGDFSDADPDFQKINFAQSPYKDFAKPTLETAAKFYDGLGEMHLTIVNKLGKKVKPSWAEAMSQALNVNEAVCDFVDCGTGKASLGRKNIKYVEALNEILAVEDIAKIEEGDLADALANREDWKVLSSKCAGILAKTFSKNKTCFGFTGKWRNLEKEKFDTFAEALEEKSKSTVKLITGNEEAHYGTLSICQIAKSGLCRVAKEKGFRFIVSVESGNGSTQVGVALLLDGDEEPAKLRQMGGARRKEPANPMQGLDMSLRR